MPPVVILCLDASVVLPSLKHFPADIIRVSLCDSVLLRACFAPSYMSLCPRPILSASPPTYSSSRQSGAQGVAQRSPSRVQFSPGSTEEAWSEGGGGRGRGARVPIWPVLACFTNIEYVQRHCLLPRTSVRLSLSRLHFPLCYRTTNTITPVSHLATCIRLKSATNTKARRQDRMANQRFNLSCNALALQPIR